MDTACESKQMVGITENDFKLARINLLKIQKEAMIKKVKRERHDEIEIPIKRETSNNM